MKAKNDGKRRRFDVSVRIWNDHDERVSFDLGNVRLLFNGREVAAKSAEKVGPPPVVQLRSNLEFRWYFELGEEAGPGTYQIEIRDLKRGDLPLGDTAVFTINV
ncbi:MAG: hypothetical protein ABIP94_12800 [Planctomycetota bacterium]